MANAHAWRHRNGRGKPCDSGCIYCKARPKNGKGGRNYRNQTGHRRNLYKSKNQQGKRRSQKKVKVVKL